MSAPPLAILPQPATAPAQSPCPSNPNNNSPHTSSSNRAHRKPTVPFFTHLRRLFHSTRNLAVFWLGTTIVFLAVSGKDYILANMEDTGLRLILETFPSRECSVAPSHLGSTSESEVELDEVGGLWHDGLPQREGESSAPDILVIGQNQCEAFTEPFAAVKWAWVPPPPSVLGGQGKTGVAMYFGCQLAMWENLDCAGEPGGRVSNASTSFSKAHWC